VSIDLLVENGWRLLTFSHVIAKGVMDASKTQLIRSHLEAFCVQTLAIDLGRCLIDLCLSISIEVLFQLLRSFFDTASKLSIMKRFALNCSSATYTTHSVDSVELYKHGTIPDFDMNLSSI